MTGLNNFISIKEIREYFEKFGKLKSFSVIKNTNTKDIKGYAFLIADSKTVAEILKSKVHYVKKVPIKVKLYVKRKESVDPFRTNSIYVGNLPFTVNESQLRGLFSFYGSILDVKILKGKAGKYPNYAFICFNNKSSCQKVVNSNKTFRLDDRILAVNFSGKKKEDTEHTMAKEKALKVSSKRTKSADRMYISNDFIGPYKIKPSVPACVMYSPI